MRGDLDRPVNQCAQGIPVVRSDPAGSDSAIVQLEATGFEVVSTDSSTQGIALRSVAAVVLHHRAEDRTRFGRRPIAPVFRSSC